ncbi:MAG: hypothetical protein SFV15_26610, partial [Polyangiaceae bacterium]|nr:hypothetical protein [Polyangiaceae bacterium]
NAGDKPPSTPKRWAWMLKHVFSADLDICPRCGGAMRWSDAATTTEDKSSLRLTPRFLASIRVP